MGASGDVDMSLFGQFPNFQLPGERRPSLIARQGHSRTSDGVFIASAPGENGMGGLLDQCHKCTSLWVRSPDFAKRGNALNPSLTT